MRNLLYAMLYVVVGLNGLWASEPEAKPFTYPYDMKVYDLPTAANGVDYQLIIRAPLRPPADGEKSSTFYFLDALANMTPAAAMSYNYEIFNYIPSAYFVGIGYKNEEGDFWKEENRTRDYTPTKFKPPAGHFLEKSRKDWVGSGGAPAFFDVVEKEIIPFMEANFDVHKMDRVLIGKSTSGLGATYALLNKPGLFNRYVIISPAIWWDDWLLPREERWVMKAARATKETEYSGETRVYFAVGEAEERLDLVTDLYVLANNLRKRRNDRLKINLEVLSGEQHEGVFPSAFMRGIVGVYAGETDRKPSSSPLKWE
ncbi:alpha/beta hydrolase [Kordiimonas sp. SCSIO 12610]|uniref:alpha/beta hydrolase n=1 Tax=Kordiimonas sp. SCSIO 12610 TaxID=2829597 RepID=UPI002109AF38|nr:alpha/beta hydrolase-fold protein [Kordiimonas sp. SCSIO 12610]UTW54622.1 alpha/beta hydrolase [Kordiimonas sp. SCSIO 12610]